MNYRRLKSWGAVCLSLVIICGNLSGSTVNMQQVQARMNHTTAEVLETKKTNDTKDIEFLKHCDNKDLINRTVTDKQAEEMLSVVNTVIEKAKTDYEKAQMLHTWVNTNIKYEASHVAISAEPYQVFKDRRGVCGGFANLYRELLNLAGIPAVVVSGYYNDPNYGYLAHAWNLVYVDNKWVIADGTGWGLFDNASMVNTHLVMEVADTSIVSDGLKIGYYHGVAVVGTQKPTAVINIPDTCQDMPITAISYKLFDAEYGVEKINIGANINYIAEDTLKTSVKIKEITVSENNTQYASKGGALFSKDYRALIYYPKASEADTFTMPAQTTSFDIKEALCSPHLKNLYVEEGNQSYASYDGALYNADKTELLFVPLGKTSVRVPENAQISGTAFANADMSKITIYGKKGSPAEQYALLYKDWGIKFVEICEHSMTAIAEKTATCTENGNYAYYMCTKCNVAYKDAKGEVETTVQEEIISATGHAFGVEFTVDKEATCKEAGSKSRHCTKCNETTEVTVIPMTEHKFGVGKITTAPTATTEGVKTFTCSVCNDTKIEKIPATGEVTDNKAPQDSENQKEPEKQEQAETKVPAKGAILNLKGLTYKVTKSSLKGATVTFVKAKKDMKTITVPATIKVKGITYKVTAIEKNAFKNQKRVTKITIGSNVSKLGATMFTGCKKLKTVMIKSTKLTKKNITKNAFKGLGKTTRIVVPKKKVSSYKTIFRSKGLNSKVKVTK